MKVKPLLLASMLIAGLLAAFGLWAASQLPDDALLPVHWNAAGQADRFAPALEALLFAPALLAAIGICFALIPRLEPLQDRLEASAPALRTAWLGMIALVVFIQLFIAAPVFGIEAQGRWILVAVGVLFIALGNVLPKTRPGFFVGIRTPWTIIDTDTWIATHRLGAKCFMGAGALMIAGGLIGVEGDWHIAFVAAAVLLAAVVPIVYSWWHWQSGRGGAGRGGEAT